MEPVGVHAVPVLGGDKVTQGVLEALDRRLGEAGGAGGEEHLNEAAVFVYDFDRFDAADILPMFAKYNITTFCAPPTMYRT